MLPGIEHVEEFEDAAADRVLCGDAVQLLGGRIGECHSTIDVGGDNGVRHVFEDLSEVALLLAIERGHRNLRDPFEIEQRMNR